MKSKLLENLNERQKSAVIYNEGPQLVIAGAGSGKTRVLTHKIAYLIEQGVNPWNILALTFTNKAANEMKGRVAGLVGEDKARNIYMGTFHSIFSRILRMESKLLGYTPDYTIYDETDSRSMLKGIIKGMQFDDKAYKPSTVHGIISNAKNNLVKAEDFIPDDHTRRKMPAMPRIYEAYDLRLRRSNAMDFDDLLLNTYLLLRQHEEVRRKYARLFQYVLVDEYQDTNYTQQCILIELTKENRHISVVGDDAQSIYAFRGANIDNILNFKNIFPDAQLFKLEQNYRSTELIVEAANSLIKHNERQIPKDVFSKNSHGDPIKVKAAYSDKEEAIIVCNEIKKLKKRERLSNDSFAVLYRANFQSRSFEQEMRKQGVPYRIYGGLSFYQRKEIKDALAYMSLAINPVDEEAFKRVVNYPARGIGSVSLARIAEAAGKMGVSFWEVARDPLRCHLEVSKSTLKKLESFTSLIENFQRQIHQRNASELGRDILKESGMIDDIYSGSDPEMISRQENIEEFLTGLSDFVETNLEAGNENQIFLPDFLQEVSLLTDLDSDDDDTSKVSLMTIHAAKGLEFPVVFVVGLEENIFPSPLSASTIKELEEERRLFYVAITRAEKHCFLTFARNRWRYGKMEFNTPSRFLNDIQPDYLDMDPGEWAESEPEEKRFPDEDDEPFFASGAMNHQMQDSSSSGVSRFDPRLKPVSSVRGSAPAVPLPDISVGKTIEHQKFGIGRIVQIDGNGENTKATVDFRNSGRRQLLLKFAKFKVLED